MTTSFERTYKARFLSFSGIVLAATMALACSSTDPSPDPGPSGTGGGGGHPYNDSGAPDDGKKLALTEIHADIVEGVDSLLGLVYAKDGKIYASGYVNIDGDRHTAAVRFNADGSLDTSFGENGVAAYNVAIADDDAHPSPPDNYVAGAEGSYGLVELANGDIVVQTNVNDGEGGVDVVLVKFDAEGNFDDDFGVVRVDLGWENGDADWPGELPPSDQAWDIGIDRSGDIEKVVVFAHGPAKKGALDDEGAQRTDNDRYIVRLLASDGSLDTSFADGGIYTFDVDGAMLPDGGRRGRVEADGSILQAGYTDFGEGEKNHIAVLRLNPDGTPDEGFGFGTGSPGLTKFNPFKPKGGMAEAYAVVRQSSGAYVTTGYGLSHFDGPSDENDLVSFRIANGALDTGYGRDGAFAVQSELDPEAGKGARPYRDNGRDLVLLGDDQTLQVGCYDDHAALFLVGKDGGLDESFGDGGKLVYDHGQPFFKAAASDSNRFAAVTQGGAAGVLLAIFEVEED